MTEHVYVDKAVEPKYAEPIVTGVSVLRPKRGSASNGGLSSRADYCALYPAGTMEHEVRPDQVLHAVTIEHGNLPGTVIAVPVVAPGEGKTIGPMFGGAYIATSDSRFREEVERVLNSGNASDRHQRFYGAVALHDRWETQAQYDALSR